MVVTHICEAKKNTLITELVTKSKEVLLAKALRSAVAKQILQKVRRFSLKNHRFSAANTITKEKIRKAKLKRLNRRDPKSLRRAPAKKVRTRGR